MLKELSPAESSLKPGQVAGVNFWISDQSPEEKWIRVSPIEMWISAVQGGGAQRCRREQPGSVRGSENLGLCRFASPSKAHYRNIRAWGNKGGLGWILGKFSSPEILGSTSTEVTLWSSVPAVPPVHSVPSTTPVPALSLAGPGFPLQGSLHPPDNSLSHIYHHLTAIDICINKYFTPPRRLLGVTEGCDKHGGMWQTLYTRLSLYKCSVPICVFASGEKFTVILLW